MLRRKRSGRGGGDKEIGEEREIDRARMGRERGR